mmetsp:Transcript_93755/g.248901  ORF Transcript_93755/g.248901 Transcript_93755/m.248901 type:complete len:268 (-) Transcript_93755:64-867(-)
MLLQQHQHQQGPQQQALDQQGWQLMMPPPPAFPAHPLPLPGQPPALPVHQGQQEQQALPYPPQPQHLLPAAEPELRQQHGEMLQQTLHRRLRERQQELQQERLFGDPDPLPLLIWCGFELGFEYADLQLRHRRHYCRSPVHFARWLFMQERGEVVPFGVLVVTWSEARACLRAIRAACTGDDSDLRIDQKRPQLPPPVGGPRRHASPSIAVGSVVITAERESSYTRALRMVEQDQDDTPGIDLQVVFMAPENPPLPPVEPGSLRMNV